MVGIFDPASELLPHGRRNYTCVLLPLYLLSDLGLGCHVRVFVCQPYLDLERMGSHDRKSVLDFRCDRLPS
jgi:hypothetical protein